MNWWAVEFLEFGAIDRRYYRNALKAPMLFPSEYEAKCVAQQYKSIYAETRVVTVRLEVEGEE